MWKSRFTMLTIFVLLSGIVIMIKPSAQETELAQMVFHSNRDRHFEIYVMNSDGKKQTRLTNNPATDSEPAWFDPRFARAVEPPGKLKSTWE